MGQHRTRQRRKTALGDEEGPDSNNNNNNSKRRRENKTSKNIQMERLWTPLELCRHFSSSRVHPAVFFYKIQKKREKSRVSRNKEQDYYKGIGTALFVFFPVRSKCAQSRVKRVLRALVFLLPLITFQPAGVNNNNNHSLAYRRGFLFSRSLIGSVFPFSMLSCRRVATTTACHRGIKRRS